MPPPEKTRPKGATPDRMISRSETCQRSAISNPALVADRLKKAMTLAYTPQLTDHHSAALRRKSLGVCDSLLSQGNSTTGPGAKMAGDWKSYGTLIQSFLLLDLSHPNQMIPDQNCLLSIPTSRHAPGGQNSESLPENHNNPISLHNPLGDRPVCRKDK